MWAINKPFDVVILNRRVVPFTKQKLTKVSTAVIGNHTWASMLIMDTTTVSIYQLHGDKSTIEMKR